MHSQIRIAQSRKVALSTTMAFALVFSIASYAMAKPSSRPQLRATVERQAVRTQPMQRVNSGGPNRSWNNNREVLNRDARINQRINNNYGHLNGQYWNLEKQDQHIYNQDQRDLRANGGQLTGQEYRQLNREENALSQETRLDNTNNPFTQNHPRRAEVLARDARLNYGINSDEGHLGGHYNQLMGEDRSIARQEQTDASINGGFITKGQQGQLNREENALAQQVRYDNTNNPFVQNHPRRSEVLGRDSSLNYQINKDEGALNGQYGQLMSEDKSIRSQEQADARANGGYITTAQQQQLNQEENQLRQQIIQDHQ